MAKKRNFRRSLRRKGVRERENGKHGHSCQSHSSVRFGTSGSESRPRVKVMARYFSRSSLLAYSLLGTVFAFSDLLNDLHVFTGPILGGQLYQMPGPKLIGFDQGAKEEKCWEDLGCFGIEDEFYDAKYRPVNVLPQNREDINTRFLLFTRLNRNQPKEMKSFDLKTLEEFQSHRLTKVIIHGWIDSMHSVEWLQDMKDALLNRDDFNVIIVDWSGGNKLPYTRATANARVVAAELSKLLLTLMNVKLIAPESVHIIGHSLGAHIGGYAGQRVPNLGRITALDPAEPYFQNMPVSVRIDPSDALFVDAWHTDATSIYKLGLGMNELVGHVDFFPNNGRDQPGCFITDSSFYMNSGIISGIRRLFACSHERAIYLFIDAINRSPCQHMAHACSSWSDFVAGKCGGCGEDGRDCSTMDLDMDKIQYEATRNNRTQTQGQKFFIKTADKAPYCVFHYKLTVELMEIDANNDINGRFLLKILGQNGLEPQNVLGESSENLDGSKTYLVTSTSNLKEIVGVKLKWKSSRWLYAKEEIHVKRIHLSTLSSENKRTQLSRTFCLNDQVALPSDTSLLMTAC